MKHLRLCTALMVATFATGCSNPKSAIIPVDSNKWDSLAKDTKGLSEEDRKELTAYLMRSVVTASFGGKSIAVAPGTTVGEAINQQRKFEDGQKLEQAKEAALKANIDAQRAAIAKQISQALTFSVVSITEIPEDYMAQRLWPQLKFIFALKNNSNKDITALKGDIIFSDSFGGQITTMNLSMDDTIPANQTEVISKYYLDIRTDEQKRLSSMDLSKVHTSFVADAVAYSDGSNLRAPDEPSSN